MNHAAREWGESKQYQRALDGHVDIGQYHPVEQPAATNVPAVELPRRPLSARVILTHLGVEGGIRLPHLDHGASPMTADQPERYDGLTVGFPVICQLLREVPARSTESVYGVVRPGVIRLHVCA